MLNEVFCDACTSLLLYQSCDCVQLKKKHKKISEKKVLYSQKPLYYQIVTRKNLIKRIPFKWLRDCYIDMIL